MKKLLTTLVCLATTMVAMAQGVIFEPEGTTLEEASAKAKAENKRIFLDCYTQWCGPCKKMAREVFPLAEVGAAMNPQFVCLKMDMESAYGAPLAKTLQIQAYPTFIIFNADAEEISRFLGYHAAGDFLRVLEEKGKDEATTDFKMRFEAGERDPQFLHEYLASLTATYKGDEANVVAEAILEGREASFARDSVLRRVFFRHITNPFAPAFVYTAQHPEALKAAVGEAPVDMKIQNVLSGYQRQLITERDGTATLDEERYEQFCQLLTSLHIAHADHYRLATLITLAEKQKDFKAYVAHIKQYLAHDDLDADDMQLARWARPFAAPEADAEGKEQMKGILRERLDDIAAGKRQPMTQVGNMKLSRPTDELLRMLIDAFDGKMPQH